MKDLAGKYILRGHRVVPEPDVFRWCGWWLWTANRRVAKTKISERVTVSTVFLGLNHNFGGGAPLLFETMIFGGKRDGECHKYSTWKEAEVGHKKIVDSFDKKK